MSCRYKKISSLPLLVLLLLFSFPFWFLCCVVVGNVCFVLFWGCFCMGGRVGELFCISLISFPLAIVAG